MLHAIEDPVELFDDPVEATGCITAVCRTLHGRTILGGLREMNPARHADEPDHAPHQRQPLQRPLHATLSC